MPGSAAKSGRSASNVSTPSWRTDDAQLIKQLDKDPRLLIVAPLSGHHATAMRDTVRMLLAPQDVDETEWRDARAKAKGGQCIQVFGSRRS